MSIHVISRVLQHSRQVGSTRMVLTVIAEHADHDGWCFPGMVRIAKRAGLKERQTRTHIRALEAAGELYCYQQRGRHRPNQYLVTVGLDEVTIAQALAQRFPRAFDAASAAGMAHTLTVRQYGECSIPGECSTPALQYRPSSAAVNTGKTGNEPIKIGNADTKTGNIGYENRQSDCRRTVIENRQDESSEREAAAPRPPAIHKQEEGFGSETPAQPIQAPTSNALEPAPLYGQEKTQAGSCEVIKGAPESGHDDSSLTHEAVQVYCKLTEVKPTPLQRHMIVETVKDCTRWTQVLKDWMLHGWRPTNVFGMLERYQNGDSLQRRGRNRRSIEEYRARIETHKDEPSHVVNNKVNLETWGRG